MSVKLKVSATAQKELDEILDALQPVIIKHNFRVKRKVPSAASSKLTAYVETRDIYKNIQNVI